MTEEINYEPDFTADKIPVWFIETEGTIAYHLYPECGHINQRSKYDISKTMINFQGMDSFQDWKEQLRSNRHMCQHCLNRFTSDWMKAEM